MLLDLSVRNIVLIESLDIECKAGLTAFTGETGAGKSILLDSVALALGARSDSALLRTDCERATVNAQFSLPAEHPTRNILKKMEIFCSSELNIRRVLGKDGRSRAFIEDQPVNVGLLNQVGNLLVEMQGQFDQQGLMNQKNHLIFLDGFAQLQEERVTINALWQQLKQATEKLTQAKEAALNAERDSEWIDHSLTELEQLNPEIGEAEQLSAQRSMLMNAEKLKETLNMSLNALSVPEGAENFLNTALVALEKAESFSQGRFDSIIGQVEQSLDATHDAVSALNRLASTIEGGSNELEETEDRLFALRDIARKHRVDVDELPALKEKLALQKNIVQTGASQLKDLEEEVEKLRLRWLNAAHILSDKRKKAANIFDQRVNIELPPLKLERALFQTAIRPYPEAQWNGNGIDDVGFFIQTNPGSPTSPLHKTASGGELSRILLALNVVLADTGDANTLIFDEVDSGVGGATATAVGVRLKALSRHKQILVVTHSPQVAALADTHFQVIKSITPSGTTVTGINILEQSERIEEIARMLSGAKITAEARAAAERLMTGH